MIFNIIITVKENEDISIAGYSIYPAGNVQSERNRFSDFDELDL